MLLAVTSGGTVPADDCCSPLWVTGDCNLFVDGEEATGIAADFTSQVARLVRLPLHGMSRFGEGVSPLVEELQRDTAVRPRVVLWVVSSAGGRAAWEQIRVPSAIGAQAEGKGGAAPFGDLRGRQVRILQTPSLEKLAGSPYPDAVGAFEAEEVRTKVRLSLIFIVKRNGSVEPRLPQRGQEIQFDGCSWESQTEARPETRRWPRMESSDDLSLSQVFVESWK